MGMLRIHWGLIQKEKGRLCEYAHSMHAEYTYLIATWMAMKSIMRHSIVSRGMLPLEDLRVLLRPPEAAIITKSSSHVLQVSTEPLSVIHEHKYWYFCTADYVGYL